MGSLTTECLCGKTSLELSGKPRFQVLCHCTICQKLTGSGDMHAVIGSCTAAQRRLMACHAIENEVMHLKHAKVNLCAILQTMPTTLLTRQIRWARLYLHHL
jgi:hypothetical protein